MEGGGGGEFQHGLFGCFDNLGVCIVTYILPCYTFGKTAEAVGESCFLCGAAMFVPFVNLYARLSVRAKVREGSGIQGSCMGDLCTIMFCPFCAIVQEAQEVIPPDGMFMARS